MALMRWRLELAKTCSSLKGSLRRNERLRSTDIGETLRNTPRHGPSRATTSGGCGSGLAASSGERGPRPAGALPRTYALQISVPRTGRPARPCPDRRRNAAPTGGVFGLPPAWPAMRKCAAPHQHPGLVFRSISRHTGSRLSSARRGCYLNLRPGHASVSD